MPSKFKSGDVVVFADIFDHPTTDTYLLVDQVIQQERDLPPSNWALAQGVVDRQNGDLVTVTFSFGQHSRTLLIHSSLIVLFGTMSPACDC